MGSLPDFSDPLMGFEPRGTDIGIRLKAWTKLQQNTGPGKFLSSLPHPHQDTSSGRDNNKEDTIEFQEFSRQRLKRMLDQRSAHHKFFCEPPGGKYAKLVFRSGNSASLWSLKAIYSMCEMEQSWIRSQAHFQELCKSVKLDVDTPSSKGECCPSWSLGNYLVFLNNVSSCFSLTQQQVSETLSLLRHCAPYYHDGRLVPSCAERGQFGQCATVPTRCKHSGAIYQILNFLVDKDFLGPQTVEYQVPSLKYSLMFLPVERGASLMEIYLNHLEGHELTYKNTTITGMDLGIKQKLFKYYLARDSVYPVLAVVVLLSAMALYHRSFFLLTVSFLAVTCSLLTSYFFYRVAFQLKFFPFLNLTAVLVLFGSCANYTFTFFDSWAFHLSYSPPASVESRMSRVMQEIGCLILTSGLTSSATFFAGYVSSITAIRCFAVFMGTASLVNTVFAFVWLPCSLVLLERYIIADPTSASDHRWKPCCSKNIEGFWDTTSRKRCLFNIAQKIRGLKRGLSDTSNILFLKILPCGVVKFRYIWICWFAVFAAGGTYISCVGPGMKLPSSDSQDTQLFRSSHPFERYDSEYRHQFMFERKKRGEDKPYTITIVWGIIPTDSGDHFDPKSEGNLVLDPDFNMSSPDAQVWLRDLCAKIQNQSFYSQSSLTHEAKEDNACFVEQLVHWVSIRHCSENEDSFLFCCNNIPFPYPSEVFEHCIKMMTIEQHLGGILPNEGGLRFDSQGRISAFIVEFSSSHLYSFNFSQTTYFYNEIQAWFQKEMSGAPPGLHKGWFVSQLTLYDLQDCLSSETLEIAGFSIVLTFAMLLLTTWNIPLSIYGTAAVGGSVFVTVGLLVLLEWQLNGIEALLISAAAGLSVDFAANYCISYSLAPHTDRLGRVAHSLKRMGCPVATGAGAYFCVGVLMLPATALLFRKVGIFLLLVKCVACGFATFFFQSLCCFFGPQKNCGRIFLPCTTEKTAESVLSSCSAAEPGSSNPSANGAFGCSSRPGDQRNFNKEAGGGFLCPHQQHQRPRATGDGREPEQYELQPLACQLSDSFENSTCTSKLSNRPSVLSDDIQFYGHSPRTDYDLVSMEDDGEDTPSGQLRHCNPPPALQTSSPYKENALYSKMIPPDDLVKDKILCKKCRSQSGANKNCNPSISSTSTEDIAVGQITSAARGQRLLLMDEASRGTLEQHPHKRLLSCQSQSSLEGPEDSNETCLSDIESGSINPQTTGFDIDGDLQPGHLNGKRDTLRLSLRGNVYDTASLGGGRGRTSQSDLPVILPNSKPDLPDVWIKRGGNGS
ncbi:protein dispatched homolog 2 isoform X2 [Denticeps clupeoides]|nr:protein dispatched homolog 2 isoform X2 [Denticeps clupeoides]